MNICEKCGKKQINVLAPLLHAAITNDLLYEFVLLCYEDGISLTFKHILKLLSTNIISKITDTKINFKTFSDIIDNTDNEIILNVEDINTSLYDEIRLYVRANCDYYAQNKQRIHNKLYEAIFIAPNQENTRACICYLFKWLQDKNIYLSAAIIANINYTISSTSLIWEYDEFYDIITDEKNINMYNNKHLYRFIFNLLKHEDSAECKLSIPIIGKCKKIYKFIYYDYIVYNFDINKLKIIFDEEFREYADNNYDDIIKKDSVLQAFKYVSDDYIKLDPVASRFFAENPNYIEDSADDSDDSASADTSVYADVD